MSAVTGFLVVRCGPERFGLPLADVREVLDVQTPRAVPAANRALRGVMPYRERFVSLVHLGALVTGSAPPRAPADTVVIVDARGAPLALEVDEVEAVVDRPGEPVGSSPATWSVGIWRLGGELVTVVDLSVLAERLSEAGSAV